MKFLWFNIETKKELRKKIVALEADCSETERELWDLRNELGQYEVTYPLTIGDTVYDIQLRNAQGRYAKKNPSRNHSYYNKVMVTKKNYFGLVERYRKNDVFLKEGDAIKYIDDICK